MSAMKIEELKNDAMGAPVQKNDFRSGNEMAARAIAQINYHVMGYFPITPSTEIAEYLDEMKTQGEHEIALIPADGEHGSAGICYGASLSGGRVVNATSSQGFLYMLEQLPVQSGTRFPMVLNLVTRSVSGPLDIRGDHSDLYYAWNLGWPILLAQNPQAVYDLNIIALRLAEHADVRLPVIIAYDGFFTSHQKRRVSYFEDGEVVRRFVGERPQGYTDVLDVEHPVTVGAYMNGQDYMTNKWEQSNAMYRAEKAFEEIAAEYSELSGRDYRTLDLYRMDDAEVALFLINSAADTAKEVADGLRANGIRAGVVAPTLLRPFPKQAVQRALAKVKALVVGERADSYGGYGGQLSHEVKSALQEIQAPTKVLTRIYGLGGVDFTTKDAEEFYGLCLNDPSSQKEFDYTGPIAVEPETGETVSLPALTKEQTTGFVSVTQNEATGELAVKVPPLRALTAKAKRIAPGHGACPGCGIFPSVETFLKGIEGPVVVLYQTGCGMITTTGYPYTAHRVTFIHNLFQNGAATLSGVVEMFHERQRRGEIPADEDITFVMVTGDGGMDIGMGAALGAASRNHKMIILEYDNEGYMNTGAQQSYATPLGQMTSTSHVGNGRTGKTFQHKDTPQIMVASGIPYVFTGVEAYPQDLIKKAAKAQWYAQHEGMAYGKVLSACPLNWRSKDEAGSAIVKAAVDSCFFPLYEVERGVTHLTYNPEEKGKRVLLTDWLSMMGKSRHLTKPENQGVLEAFSKEVEKRWEQIKAKSENPVL